MKVRNVIVAQLQYNSLASQY